MLCKAVLQFTSAYFQILRLAMKHVSNIAQLIGYFPWKLLLDFTFAGDTAVDTAVAAADTLLLFIPPSLLLSSSSSLWSPLSNLGIVSNEVYNTDMRA